MITSAPNGCIISLYVLPNAPRTEIIGEYNNQLKIKIKAPPVDGKANEAIIEFFCEFLRVPKKNLEILRGGKSKAKKLFIRGLSAAEITALLSL